MAWQRGLPSGPRERASLGHKKATPLQDHAGAMHAAEWGEKGLPGARGTLALKAAAARPPPLVALWRWCSGPAGGRRRRLRRASEESRLRRRPQATRKVLRRASAKRSVWNDNCLPLNASAVQAQPEAAKKGGHFHVRVNTRTQCRKRLGSRQRRISSPTFARRPELTTRRLPAPDREGKCAEVPRGRQLFPTAGLAAWSGPWWTTYPELRPARL